MDLHVNSVLLYRLSYKSFTYKYQIIQSHTKSTPIPDLIRISKPAHPGHNAQHIVVDGKDKDVALSVLGSAGESELESGIVDAREIARAGRLVLLGLERERVDVDAV